MRNHVVTPAKNPTKAARLAALLAGAALAACAPEAAPDPEALARYRGASQAAPAPSATTGDAPAAAAPAAPPPAPAPARRVRLTVVSGKDIPDMDAGPGTTDAYVVLEYDSQRQKTSIADGPAPTWNDSFVFDVHESGALMATLMDSDALSDETIGVVTVQLPSVAPGATEDLELSFREGQHGTVLLRVEGLSP